MLLGPSRKGMIGKVLGVGVDDRMEGTLALVALAVAAGADAVRVHDVREMSRAARVLDALAR
jgi:dihydropteroate synthase